MTNKKKANRKQFWARVAAISVAVVMTVSVVLMAVLQNS